MNAENWKAVTGWEGLYEVSDLGRVRSLPREVYRPTTPFKIKGRVLKQFPDKNGYPAVKLCGENTRTKVVHQIVCEAFHGPKPEGCVVAHNDGTKTNARADNLRWATFKENSADAIEHDQLARGERHVMSRLKEVQVVYIKLMRAYGVARSDLARKFGVTYGTIRDIEQGRRWQYLERAA
ncbi:NUMOD4 domain-containing protein [Novosphingobium sp.]|uniref:NUMOD4 domain-containing protein n=1 Tax=Novosphingobium sp. TaxID=1874826 RepID=UPI0035615536